MNDPALEKKSLARKQPQRAALRWGLVVIVLGLMAGMVSMAVTPWRVGSLRSQPHPVFTYAGALQRIEALQKQEAAPMNPACRLQLMTHDQRVAHAIVLVHGYTSCPEQFHALGQQFYALGYNVLIAPLPHHGLADRMTEAQALLRAEELVAYSDQVVDIAHGLGEHVTMAGISLGANVTAWAAQNRSDLDRAVIISPAFGFQQIATPLTAPVMNYYLIRPNLFTWFNASLQEGFKPDYQYPRSSTRALAQVLRLGFAVQRAAHRTTPAARSILVITNPSDSSVNPVLITEVVDNWRAHHAPLATYEFDAALNLPHDLVDQTKVDQRIETEIVYPRLIDLITP